MSWLAPLWLAAVAAVGIPLFIHLRRRRIGRRIQVGSIRHLAGAATPRRRRLQVRDPWVLALRSLIIALPAVALAEPVIARHGRPAWWALVAPELAADSGARQVTDSLQRAGAAIRFLAPGFPATMPAAATDSTPDLWSLLRRADLELPADSRITLVVRPRLALARGARPAIRSAVDIRPVAVTDTAPVVEAAWESGGTVSRLMAEPAGGGVTRVIRTGPATVAAPLAHPDSITVRIVADSGRIPDATYVEAAFRAAAEATDASPTIGTVDPQTFRPGDVRAGDWTVWLSGTPVPAVPGVVVTEGRGSGPADESARAKVEAPASQRPTSHALRFNARLGISGGSLLLSPAFPETLARYWLDWSLGAGGGRARGGPAIAPSQLLPNRVGSPAPAGSGRPLRGAVLALMALLLLGERWLAFRRR